MSHRMRVASSTQVEIIEQALHVFTEMRDHLESCTACTDESFCKDGGDIYQRMFEEKRRLKIIDL